MQIRVKKDKTSQRMLLKNSIPLEVVKQIIGKTFDYLPDGGGFAVAAVYCGKPSRWSLAPECVEIVDKDISVSIKI